MIMRLIGFALTLAVIGYLFYSFNKSESSVSNVVNNNASVQEQKAALESAGVNTSNSENVIDYSTKKALEIRAYQDQLNEQPSEQPQAAPVQPPAQ